jgi:hypothetical protein
MTTLTLYIPGRIPGANRNLTCSTTGQSNALGQDISNSDSIAVGNYDFSFVQDNGSPGSGNMITQTISPRMEIVSLLAKMPLVLASILLSQNMLVEVVASFLVNQQRQYFRPFTLQHISSKEDAWCDKS